MKDRQNGQYVEGNNKIRYVCFAFFTVWFLSGLLFKWLSEEKLKQIDEIAKKSPEIALSELREVSTWYWNFPMTIFFLVQGGYLLWMGVITFRTGIHPPPGTKMPFRTKVRTGNMARIMAGGYLLAAICNFVIIALLFVITGKIRPV